MSYSRYKMVEKFVNGIPTGEFTQGDLIQAGPFDTFEECNEGNASPSVTPDNPNMLYRWVASNEPWCDGTDEYKTEKQQQSADLGKSWTDTGATRKGEFVKSHSFTCGFVAERWIEVNPNVDFICENGNKYYLQKKEISTDGVNWTDSGDKRKGPLIEANSADCSYPQYRWVEISLDVDYECVGEDKYYKEKEQVTNDGKVWSDTGRTRRGRVAEVHSTDCGYEPPTTVTRWIVAEGEFICQGVNKYQKEKEQISEDSGQTWQDTGNTRAGALIEKNSYFCGYVSFRWVDVPNEYVCQGTDKYAKQNEEKTTDGQTWIPTGRTRTGALIEKNSYSCGYVSYRWVTVENEYVCSGTDKYTKEKEQSSTDGSVWQYTGRERAGSLIERDSSYCKEPPAPVQSDYLTFTALEDGTFYFGNRDLYYSFDKVEWTRLTSPYETPTIAAGNKIYFKGTITPEEDNGVGTFSSTGRFTASGNVMSLIYGDDFEGQTSLSGKSYAFSNLFWQCPNLTSIDGLSLPATTLSDWCYLDMFYGCSGLTTIPSGLLPSTTLADHCYVNMFTHCEGLTSIPSGLLPASTLKQHCYDGMFAHCYGLTSIPSGLLLATTLAPYCCVHMFSNCTSLTTIPSNLLKATTLADHCYYEMFYECSGLTSIPSGLLPSTTLADNCYDGMFAYCTGLITIPSGLLLATTLSPYCCANMFFKCSKLTTIPSDLLKATTLADHCYYNMFCLCTNITTAPDLLADTLVSRCYERMFYKCAKLNSIRMLATDVSATECLINWVLAVSQTGTFYKAAGVTIPTGMSGIPSGWTVVEATRWVVDPVAYICQGTDKYHQENEEMTTDGTQWIPTGRTRAGSLIETQSEDCGYVQSDYLTFTALEDGTFKFTNAGLSYSTDRTNWTALAANANTPTITAGDKIYFKGTMTPSTSYPYGIGTFSSTGNFTSSGTPMSLLFGDDFEGQTSLSGKRYAFSGLFGNCTKLKSINGLLLPATTLEYYCYDNMFYGCTGLNSIPSGLLQSTTLAEGCYSWMFAYCTSLTTIPSNLLPSTTLANYCYESMFNGCTGLTSIPSGLLPSTELAQYCYIKMFANCSSLTEIPSTLLNATTLAYGCYSWMFQNCSSITTAPDLLATTLTTDCYKFMFYGCTNLNSIRMLATDVSATDCLSNWVSNVSPTGTFYKKSGVTIETGVSGIPSGWTVVEV